MNNRARADLLSALFIAPIIMTAAIPQASASQMKEDNAIAHASLMPRTPAMSQEKIGARKYQVGTVLIDARPELVWNALTSYNRASEIFSNLKRLKVLSSEKDKKRVSFTVATLGGLCKYEYVLEISEKQDLNRIEWKRHSGAFKANDGFWQLKPVNGGTQTLVTYAKFIDGGILIPQAMVNAELKKVMPEVLSNLRTAVSREQHLAMTSK